MKTKTPQHNVRIKKNTTTQCRNKGETPQRNVGMKTKTPQINVSIKKNTTKQCRDKRKTPQHNVGIKEKHHNTM
jgi:hypothetical protein